MQGEAASIELPVHPTDITKSNQRTKRRVTCYNFTVVFVPAVIESIAKENLRPGYRAKIQSTHDTNELSQ